jgi:hypothetical protein
MTGRRIVVAFVLAACAGGGASAQVTPGEASHQLKSDLAEELKDLKASLAEAKATFFDELGAFEALVKAGDYDVSAVADLFDNLTTMMGSIGAAVRSVGNGTSTAAGDALEALAGGGDLNGVFPDGFYPGDGGSVDVLRAKVRKEQDKVIAAVAKRMRKTLALVEKHANVGMTVSLAAPGSMRDLTWDENGGFFFSDESPITCDALIGVSDLGQAADGVIFVGGTANPNLGAVALESIGPEGNTTSGGVPALVVERWSTSISGLDEGVYAISATQGTGGPLATGSVGVR